MNQDVLPRAELWVYAPVKETELQKCIDLRSNYPFEILYDRLGNQILNFNVADLPPFGVRVITVQAVLELGLVNESISPGPIRSYLFPEKYIECEALEMIQLAERLTGEDTLDTVRNIFEWVAGNIGYSGYLKNDRGALWALKNREGDCTEYMCLFVALCRAGGISSRGIGGYVMSEDGALQPENYHNWAEFYLKGKWRVADPQMKMFMKNEHHYIAMRIVGESPGSPMKSFHRFRYSGRGLIINMR